MIASIILGLHLLGSISTENAALFLFVAGGLMIVSEIFLSSGIVAFNGLIALFVGYILKTGTEEILGFPIDWNLLFGVSFVELMVIIISVILIMRYRRIKLSTGTESMIGQKAEIMEWKGSSGRVRIQGEIWKARSDTNLDLKKEETVTVEAIENLKLKISA